MRSAWQADSVRAGVSVYVRLSICYENLWRHSELSPEVFYSYTALKMASF